MGRVLSNAARFPLSVHTDAMPPLVKFASGPFGIVERFADGPAGAGQVATIPLALRRVGPQMRTRALTISAGQASDHVTTDDVQALQWFSRVQRLQDGSLTEGQWTDTLALRSLREVSDKEPRIDVRSRSLSGREIPRGS
ncbi:Alpha-2-macroglobulin OS=Castellaniella defragrans OX=75697 GN=HNR28_001586 PE=3 SV=1 [Castellaniella defragrans]